MDQGGIDMQDTNTLNPAGLSTLLSVIAPDLITWSMKDSPLNLVATKLATHQALWNGAYQTDWLYIAPYADVGAATAEAARAQAQPVIEHAVANGHDYWDPLVDCPSYAYGVARGWYGDGTHFNPTAANTIGSRMWRATGLLPELRAGNRTRNLKAPRAELDTLSVANRELIAHLRRLREASIVSVGRGVLMPAGTNTFASSLDAIAAPGLGSFTMMALLRVPSSPVQVEAIGLRPTTGGGNLAGSTVLTFRGAGLLDCRLDIRSADNASAANLVNVGAGSEFWSRPGEIVMVAVRRDISAALGSRYTIFVDGKAFGVDAAGAQTIIDQNIAATYLKVGAVSASIGASDLEVYGAAYYTSALSDSTIDLAAMSGAFPSGSDTVWTFNERSGRILAAGSSKRASLTSTAKWLQPSLPHPVENNGTFTLIANETVIANRAGGGAAVGTLPAVPLVGDFVEVHGQGAAGWRITHPNGHQIVTGAGTTVGTNATTIGTNGPPVVAPGYVAST